MVRPLLPVSPTPWLIAALLLGAAVAEAKPTGPRIFCDTYPTSPLCSGQVVACDVCHTAPPAWNSYGIEVLGNLSGNFEDTLAASLLASEAGDIDGDGVSNLEEIMLGTGPGNPEDVWVEPEAPTGDPNPTYDVGNYDLAFAFKRMKGVYCGRSPTYAEMQALAQAGNPQQYVDDALDACLASSAWRDETLPRLADKRIRPLTAVGAGPDSVIPLADFEWDYQLWKHVLTDGRDLRDLLLADYHVDANGQVVNGVINDGVSSQGLQVDKRAGMITTRWFIMIHTMFSELPRTTAAQAYRAYLGQDIARSQGILPVAGEPVDIDGKGVTEPVCARCHSTLDPLSYAFAYYEGISGSTGEFDVNRPSWTPGEVSPVFMDQALATVDQVGVTGWAQAAANSDAFARNMSQMFMEHALGPLGPYEERDLHQLWPTMSADTYAADALLHRIVDSDAFGVP